VKHALDIYLPLVERDWNTGQ